MTTITTPWAHLPNAVHIDRVIASAKANPDHWEEVRARVRYAARGGAWNILREQDRVEVWIEARNEVRIAVQYITWVAARDVLLALCAYDDCAYMLDSDPGELAILAKFDDHRAVLLLSACKAFHSIKESA